MSGADKRVAIVSQRHRWRPGFSLVLGKAFTDLIPRCENIHWVDQIHSMLRLVDPSARLRRPRLVPDISIIHRTRERMMQSVGLNIGLEPVLRGASGL